MPKCYECQYYRVKDAKCGYKGYSAYPDKNCDAGEFQQRSGECCGSCSYYSVENRRCMNSGSSKYPYERCDVYHYSRD